MSASRKTSGRAKGGGPFHIMAKPVGSACNLRCEYCFYSSKTGLLPAAGQAMAPDVLETFTRAYIQSQPGEVHFAWQGGEPTLAGLEFFERAVALQSRFGGGKRVFNALQTNGVLLDDDWCRFLAATGFLVGLSLDGSPAIHDRFRLDAAGRPTHGRVMRALECMARHRVEFNALTCVTPASAASPLEAYRFLRDAGVRFIQFIPVVERFSRARPGELAGPPVGEPDADLAPWSLRPEQWGEFLIAVFDEWFAHDIGRVFVMNFEWALACHMRQPAPTCTLAPTCGRCLAIEHNGDLYACDHYVYDAYRLGNIMRDSLSGMVESDAQRTFAAAKAQLPAKCRQCQFLHTCRGGCPKHRFAPAPAGDRPTDHLCEGWRGFLQHAAPTLDQIAKKVASSR